jgi:hypothetical protein
MRRFIDEHHQTFGVESICKTFQIAPSGYWKHAAFQRNPDLRSASAIADEQRIEQIQIIGDKNKRVYGADKIWKAMKREQITIARCTVERLMRQMGLRGVICGKAQRTTFADPKVACPLNLVKRQFKADRPNQLWVSESAELLGLKSGMKVTAMLKATAVTLHTELDASIQANQLQGVLQPSFEDRRNRECAVCIADNLSLRGFFENPISLAVGQTVYARFARESVVIAV